MVFKSLVTFLAAIALVWSVSFAEEPTFADSARTAELLEEISIRDSVMALHDSSCAAEKDSLRFAMKMESSMCESWKQSYDTMKKNYGECNQALNASLNENEKSKDDVEEARQSSIKSNIASFASGLGIGLLLLLIF